MNHWKIVGADVLISPFGERALQGKAIFIPGSIGAVPIFLMLLKGTR